MELKRTMIYLGTTLLVVLAIHSCPARAVVTYGLVLKVVDGDTLTVGVGKRKVAVRLKDIDAPELDQPYGSDSAMALVHLCARKRVRLTYTQRDLYGRVIANAYCYDVPRQGIDVNPAMVRDGHAWVYTAYAPKHSPLHVLEAEAMVERRGLWAMDNPVPPWVWRKENHGGGLGVGNQSGDSNTAGAVR